MNADTRYDPSAMTKRSLFNEINIGFDELEKASLEKVIIRTGKVEGFFERARRVAKKADSGELMKSSATVTFEDDQENLIITMQRRSGG